MVLISKRCLLTNDFNTLQDAESKSTARATFSMRESVRICRKCGFETKPEDVFEGGGTTVGLQKDAMFFFAGVSREQRCFLKSRCVYQCRFKVFYSKQSRCTKTVSSAHTIEPGILKRPPRPVPASKFMDLLVAGDLPTIDAKHEKQIEKGLNVLIQDCRIPEIELGNLELARQLGFRFVCGSTET